MNSTTVGGWVAADYDEVTVHERHAGGTAVASVAEAGEEWLAEVRAPGSLAWRTVGRYARLTDARAAANAALAAAGWDA